MNRMLTGQLTNRLIAFKRLVLQPHSCWPKTERVKRGAEVAAFGPFMQFRGCQKCAFAPSFSPEKLQIRELRL